MAIQRNLYGKNIPVELIRTLEQLDARLTKFEQMLAMMKPGNGNGSGLSASQREQVLRLVAGRSSAVIGQEVADPLVVGLPTASGTVTSLSQGTGITLTPNPTTSTGTISISTTGVTAGAYLGADITVNAQGQLTAASSRPYSRQFLLMGG